MLARSKASSRLAPASGSVGRECSRGSLVLVCAARSRSLPEEDESSKSSRPQQQQPPKVHRPVQPSSSISTGGLQDWRTARARLVALERSGKWSAAPGTPAAGLAPPPFSANAWAHELSQPEVGCLLVARGGDEMGLFSRSVVLLVSYGGSSAHSLGLVLNKCSSLTMAEVQSSSTAEGLSQVFGGQPISLGGPCHMDTLTLLHGYAGLHGAQKVLDGVYFGGVAAACEVVRTGLARPDRFRLLLGAAGWAPGQLDAELAGGSWSLAAASRELILGQARQPGGGRQDRLWQDLTRMLGRPRSRAA